LLSTFADKPQEEAAENKTNESEDEDVDDENEDDEEKKHLDDMFTRSKTKVAKMAVLKEIGSKLKYCSDFNQNKRNKWKNAVVR